MVCSGDGEAVCFKGVLPRRKYCPRKVFFGGGNVVLGEAVEGNILVTEDMAMGKEILEIL